MRRSHDGHSPKDHELPDFDPMKDIKHEAGPFSAREKGVQFASANEPPQPKPNQRSKSSSWSASAHRSSDSSTLSSIPDSRRSSTPDWFQRGGKDLRLFELQKKFAKEQKGSKAKESGSSWEKQRTPTFTDFTLADVPESGHTTRTATPDKTSASKSPAPKSPTPKSSTPKSPTPKSPMSSRSTPSRKPNMRLDLIPASPFSQLDYTKTPRLDISHFLKAITPGKSPMTKTPDKFFGEEPVDYMNVKSLAASVSDNASNSTMSSPSKEKSSLFQRLSLHRRTPSSSSLGQCSPSPLPVESSSEDRCITIDATCQDKHERPQPKRRFWSAPVGRSKEPSTPKSPRAERPELPGVLLVPTSTAPGHSRTVHYLPTEARRINTPPVHTNSGKKGYFMDLKSHSPIDEEPDPYPAGKCHQPFPMSADNDFVDQHRGSSTSTSSREKDWYKVRLDEILYTSDDQEATLQKQELSIIEWNIPEHLPSSPLCPLHPKYKGGTKGICVYHGRRASPEVGNSEEKGP